MNEQGTTRRRFLSGAASGLAAAAVASAPTTSAAAQSRKAPAGQTKKRPLNVLFFMSDDMRTELAAWASRFDVNSPNIDRLCSEGVQFSRNYCQFPLCNPSRSSLFSGKKPTLTRVLGNRDGLRAMHPDWITLPQLFKEHGYTTLRTGKLFHGGLDDPKAWTDFDGETESLKPTASGRPLNYPRKQVAKPDGTMPPLPADNPRGDHSDQIFILDGNGEGSGDYMVADRTIANLRKLKDQPFFIGCGFSKPHSPPTAPQRFFDMYDPKKLMLPPDFAAWPTVPPGFPKAAIRPRNADLFIGRGASPEEAQVVLQAYLASISWVDWNMGRVLGELDALGLRDNTVVVFVADHGYQLGEKGKWSKAGSLFEGSTRVPLIIRMPGAAGNGRPCLRMTESIDIYRTLVELAGLDLPDGIEGATLTPLLHDPRAVWDRPAFSIWSEDGKTVHGTAVRTENWRYAEYGADAANGAMLLDVHADPLELVNLADKPEHAETRARMSKMIADYTAVDPLPAS